MCFEPNVKGGRVERPLEPEGSRKRSPALGELETAHRGVQVRPSARSGTVFVEYDDPRGSLYVDDQPHQIGACRLLPAPDTCSDRFVATHQGYSLTVPLVISAFPPLRIPSGSWEPSPRSRPGGGPSVRAKPSVPAKPTVLARPSVRAWWGGPPLPDCAPVLVVVKVDAEGPLRGRGAFHLDNSCAPAIWQLRRAHPPLSTRSHRRSPTDSAIRSLGVAE